MSKSYFSTMYETIDVIGEGETKKQAIEDAFKKMRKEVSEGYEMPIVSIHTEDFIVHDMEKDSRNEAFLFLFMKRERIRWKITASIKLKIDYIQLEEGGEVNG